MNKKKQKRYFAAFAAVLFALVLMLSSCGSKAPDIDTIRDELSSLIDASAEINEILFGEGLPVYSRDGGEEEAAIYNDMKESLSAYEVVREDAKYLSIDEIKSAAELVYSEDYLESVYDMAFVGYADETVGTYAARYYEWDGWLYKNREYEPVVDGTRTYDYSTMKLVKPSRGDYINFTVDSELDGEKLTVTLSAVLTENGWRLDSPTY